MSRIILTDDLWEQFQIILKSKGCQERKNNRKVMEVILWKLPTGEPWQDVPIDLCP